MPRCRTLVLFGVLASAPAHAQIPNAFAPYWEADTSPVMWEHQQRALYDSLIDSGKTRDEALREVSDTQERQIRNFLDNRVGAMRQSLTEFMSMASAPGSQAQAGDFVTTNLRAPNLYGASTSAPFAHYSGDGTLILRATIRVRSDGDYRQDGRWLEPGRNNGWSFDLGGGVLERYVDVLNTSRTVDLRNSQNEIVGTAAQCEVAVRYVYRSVDGATELFPVDAPAAGCRFGRVPGDVTHCGSPTEAELAACDRPLAVSRNGQAVLDATDRGNPILKRADGSIETFTSAARPAELREEFLTGAAEMPWETSFNLRAGWVPATRVDRNGLVTRFEYEGDRLHAVISPRGVRTEKEPTADGFEIRTAGVGGAPQVYRYHFTTFELDYSSFGDITCRGIANGQYTDMPCSDPRVLGNTSRRSTQLLTRIELPDGTSYRYEYGPWGNLTKVRQPTGAITTFVYGEAFSSSGPDDPAGSFFPVGWTPNETSISGDPGQVPDGTNHLLARRVLKRIVSPDGSDCPTRGAPNSASCQYTLVSHELGQPVPGSPHCDRLFWIARRLPNGTVEREATCQAFSTPAKLAYSGRVIAIERYASESATRPIRAEYFGDVATGTLWVDFDRVGPLQASDRTADMRPTRIVRIVDGLATTEVISYGTWQVSPSTLRTSGNVTSRLLYAGDCREACSELLLGTVSEFAAPTDAHLLRLPLWVETFDSRGPLARTDFAYDETDVQTSTFAGLAPPATHRGNATTTRRYIDPAGTAAAVTRTAYWDTGEVYRVWGPRAGDAPDLELLPDFRSCESSAILESTARNVLGHETRRVIDCFTGNVLADIDANGAQTCTAYDEVGRAIATSLPGDGLPASGLAYAPCRGGEPTQTIEFPRSGQDGPVWTFVHRKDKTADGLISREFTDGLGRVILACREGVAPGEPGLASSGASAEGELCVWTRYDAMGRVASTSAPTFRAPADVPTAEPATHRQVFSYDALGRVTRDETFVGDAPVSELGAVVTTYTREGATLVTTITDPDGARTRTVNDALGHVIAHGVESDGVAGCVTEADAHEYCTTHSVVDGLGHVLAVTDAAGNRWENRFDGLGRRTRAVDPDTGTSQYIYDEVALIEARDAEGRATLFKYDAAGRQVVVDAPTLMAGTWVNGPSADDEITFYDYPPEGACQRCTGATCVVSRACGDADWSLR